MKPPLLPSTDRLSHPRGVPSVFRSESWGRGARFWAIRPIRHAFALTVCAVSFLGSAWAQAPAPTEAEVPPESAASEPAPADETAAPEEAAPAEEEAAPAEEAPPEEAGTVEPTEETLAAEEEPPPEEYGEPEQFNPSFDTTEDFASQKPPYTGPFRKGQIQLGISVGYAASSTSSWFVPGVSLGYFLTNGLIVHVDTDFWIGDPFIATPSPGLQFIFFMIPVVNPYIGAFYRHYFVGSGYSDGDSIGGRAGVYFLTSPRSYFGGGVVYEHMLDDDLFTDRDVFYPEFVFAFSF